LASFLQPPTIVNDVDSTILYYDLLDLNIGNLNLPVKQQT